MYELQPTQDKDDLFFRLERNLEERHGAIGYMRQDFGRDGRGFHTTWFDTQSHLKTPAFKAEFDNVINSLRDDGEKPPFASRRNLESFCANTPGKDMNTRGDGYVVRTEGYSYYFRCKPANGDYEIYCFTFDNRYLLPELAGQHELPNDCHSVLPSSGELILIVRGKQGYYPSPNSTTFPDINRKIADENNSHFGVTRAQEEAMLAGSMFGWDSPAAKPWHYDKDGNPRQPQPRKNEPER